ncbi:competence/damage-inducible protein A [Prolixibacter sp. SD074]|uniref:competence/damage-inducible protein A n=1 Tax=Prolixibacter sp. SD074 TaxID=2652391 RepID=UPI0012714FBD|nr:competence/damage-inducible protein A [Prolixibacter sp. SD074]GET28671.1 CinA-like protein [Prolixibacter sp. SD074]
MKADLITIGDEILIGQIIDTNSAWMARQLNDEGIAVRQITSISDEHDHMLETLADALGKVDLVLITGGLGPTKDDRTKDAICQFFGTQLVYDDNVLEHIKTLLAPRGVQMNGLNRDQALVPESAVVLHNRMGTAPGLWMEKEGYVFVFMPGVPFEMKTLVNEQILPRVRTRFKTTPIIHRTILSQGLPESVLAERIAGWEDNLPSFIKLAYLPNPMHIRLRLSATGDDRDMMNRVLDQKVQELITIIPEHIFGYEDDTLTGNIGKLLKQRNLTVGTAESCTGGNIAHFFTSDAGSSDYFRGSVVAYSNEVKENVLGVPEKVLIEHGAVSAEVVEAMAVGARKVLGVDYVVATSGIAGPTGGTPEKPVGLVWIAVAGPDGVVSKKYNFGNDRGRNIVRSSQSALNLLRNTLLK